MRNPMMCVLVVVLSLLCHGVVAGQEKGEREQWMNELWQYKRTYFTKELDLTREQQNKFFPLYEEMEAQTRQVNEDARLMERRVAEAPDASGVECEKAAEAMYEAKVKEAVIEKDYMEKFKEILSPRQLFRLKAVERQFSREIMRQHHRIRSIRNAEAR